jgi:hypothetical protein
MKTILMILNGINLPFHVIDFVIDKAKKESYKIYALFLKGTQEPPKGYLFPNDLATTETWTSDSDAIKDDEEIISENMKLVKEMIEDEKILYTSTLKTNASVDDVVEVSRTADLVVVDQNFDEVYLLSDEKISLKDLRDKITIPVQLVRQDR